MSTSERSLSRGRASGFQLTGRGGAGNFRSPSREPVPGERGPDDYSDTRGRDPIPSGDPNVVISTGRGGRGNIRSPSRDGVRGDDASREASLARSEQRGRGYDRELISTIDNAHDPGVHSFGRGGSGNMSGSPPSSQSRSRSREPAIHAAGRGGLGNIHAGGPSEKVIEELDESERAAHLHPQGVHSSGRGGIANLTSGKVPHLEGAGNPHGTNHPHTSHEHDAESHGRGGRGNISRDHSREPGVRNTPHVPSGLAQSVTG
ncbi:hypothetical protein V8E52_006783 [Russula decolorans]|jgi:hypothetical protein